MTENEPAPFFSVIVPTRNRTELFLEAVESVRQQSFQDYELIAVVDGSDDSNLQRYREIEADQPEIHFTYLAHRPTGHGQSYSMNVGFSLSRGQYLCFLDDDDSWTDPDYLKNVHANITACNAQVDMHYSNQRAFYWDGKQHTGPVWLNDLIDKVEPAQQVRDDCYRVDAAFLLRAAGFAHLNCSIFRRGFYEALGGMDESVRYENDRDVYLRSIDSAETILYSTHFVSRHNIPDGSKKSNMSTIASDVEKKLYQMRVYDKAICLARQRCVVNACRRSKAYELKHMAAILVKKGRYSDAAHYAREAMLTGFNLRWTGYAIYLWVLSILRPGRGPGDGSQGG